MTIQVLVAAMNQKEDRLIDRMHIQTDAIVVNQCDQNRFASFAKGEHEIRFLSLAERGVGLSRNTALMRATADIVLFADEDLRYVPGYDKIILRQFEEHPEADVVIFSVESLNRSRPLYKITKNRRIHRIEALKYGCARVAARREKLLYANICFSLLFGGGAKYGSGEDTIFIQDCIKRGLKVYTSTANIACVEQSGSTWFRGYDDKYFFDKGVLIATVMPVLCWPYILYTTFKFRFLQHEKVACENILKQFARGVRHRKRLRGIR